MFICDNTEAKLSVHEYNTTLIERVENKIPKKREVMKVVATRGSPKLVFSFYNFHRVYLFVCSDSELNLQQ